MINIEEHYGLVGWVIDRYFTSFLNKYPCITYDDLFQEGVIALIEAGEKYDRSFDTAFSTYATYGIQYTIERYVERNIRPITFSAQTPKRDREAKHLENPSEIQSYLSLSNEQITELLDYRANSYPVELDPSTSTNRDEVTEHLLLTDLKDVYADLSKENQHILRLRSEGKTLREIGESVGLSHATIANRLKRIKELWVK